MAHLPVDPRIPTTPRGSVSRVRTSPPPSGCGRCGTVPVRPALSSGPRSAGRRRSSHARGDRHKRSLKPMNSLRHQRSAVTPAHGVPPGAAACCDVQYRRSERCRLRTSPCLRDRRRAELQQRSSRSERDPAPASAGGRRAPGPALRQRTAAADDAVSGRTNWDVAHERGERGRTRFEGALRDGDRRVLGRAVSDNDTGRLKRGLPALRGCHRRAPAPRSRMSASGEMATSDTPEGTR